MKTDKGAEREDLIYVGSQQWMVVLPPTNKQPEYALICFIPITERSFNQIL